MEYSINKLGKLAGVSTRTLRYYDEIKRLLALKVKKEQIELLISNVKKW